VQTLIAIWDRVPTHDLLVVGTGNYEETLRAMAAGNPRIRFLGPLAPGDLGPLYYHAAACIIPSLAYETFGMTALEAFARKTPVIVRDSGALGEIIEESGGGFLYRNNEELTDAIERIAHSPDLRRELGEKGHDAVLRLWSREAHLRLYFDCLERVAREKFGLVPWLQS
jgi:glycosyltransferase involved in cell wall biosynthesis